MSTKLAVTCVGLVAVTWTLAAGAAMAGKPGGGGGGGGTTLPPGRIYVHDLATYSNTEGPPGGSYRLVSMDGGGANRETLLRTTAGLPRVSRLSHGGARWILQNERVSDQGDGPGPSTDRWDLFAVREDGAGRVRLTSHALTQYSAVCDWGFDEDATGATIAVTARRFTGTTTGDVVVPSSCGIYVAQIVFDADGFVTGLAAEPEFVLSVGTTGPAGNEVADTTILRWSPDMTRIATGRQTTPEIVVADLAHGTITNLGPGEYPEWAPDGSRIACSRVIGTSDTVIETLRPDGSGRTTLVSMKIGLKKSATQRVERPKWSPDGAFLAYAHRLIQGGLWAGDSVHRVAASGGTTTNLTPEVTAGSPGVYIVDWR